MGCNLHPLMGCQQDQTFQQVRSTGEYTILQAFSIAGLPKLKHHAPSVRTTRVRIRAQFLMG